LIRAHLENLPGFGGTFVYLEDSLSGENLQGFGVPQVSSEGPVFIPFHDLKYLEYLETGPF
jgi:hypothetical protein